MIMMKEDGSMFFNAHEAEHAHKEFKISVPEKFNFGFDVIDRHAENEEKRALVWVDPSGSTVKEYTYRDLSRLSNQAANVLRGLGVKKGERVFIMLGRVPEWYFVLIACHKIGAVIMPAPVVLLPSDIEYRITKGKANVLITNRANHAKVDEALKKSSGALVRHKLMVDGEAAGWNDFEKSMSKAPIVLGRSDVDETSAYDSFLIYFTSGTTKYPKMVHHLCSYPLGHL